MMAPRRGIEIRHVQYYNAAIARLADVKSLKAAGRGNSAGAAYLSGLAVECGLRALIPAGGEFTIATICLTSQSRVH